MPNNGENCAKIEAHILVMDPIPSFSDSFHTVNLEVGAKVVAGLAGLNTRTVSGYGSDPSGTQTCDAVLRACVSQARLGRDEVLVEVCRAAGGAFVRIAGPGSKRPDALSPLAHISRINRELSDVGKAVDDGLRDGTLSNEERAEALRQVSELIEAAATFRAHLGEHTS